MTLEQMRSVTPRLSAAPRPPLLLASQSRVALTMAGSLSEGGRDNRLLWGLPGPERRLAFKPVVARSSGWSLSGIRLKKRQG